MRVNSPSRTNLTLEEVSPSPGGPWDRFVDAAPGATFCHRAAWAPLLAEILEAEPLYRVARGPDGEWKAILPLFRVRSLLFGHYLVSVPFLSYGGALGSEEARRLLVQDAAREARQSGADLLEVRSREPLEPPPLPLEANPRKVTVLLDLPPDAETLFHEDLRSKVRGQVRRPLKEGMEVRFGTDQVEPFVRVFQRTMRDLGTPVLSATLFRRLPEAFGREVTFGAVWFRDRPVAAGCGFRHGEELEMTWAGALREYSNLAPNMLLYWAFMERAVEQGLQRFNFGRCTPGSGTHRFKKQWGGRDEPLPWLQWSQRGVSATPNPDSGRYAAAIEAWRRLPLPAANRLGPPLARKLP